MASVVPPAAPVVDLSAVVGARSLQQAQQYVDLLVRPPLAQTQHPTHPFRQVLDALAAARRRRREAAALALRRDGDHTPGTSSRWTEEEEAKDGEGSGEGQGGVAAAAAQALVFADGAEGGVQGSQQARADLQEAFGPFAGSAMYRDWVLRPREHLQGVVRDVASATVAALRARAGALALLLPPCDDDDDLDVHVQLLPTQAGQSRSPFCALVTVRLARPLARVEEEQAALAARLLSAAAPGQTVTSSLRFWDDVSYGDAAEGRVSEMGLAVTAAAAKGLREGGIEHYAPLGLSPLLLDGGTNGGVGLAPGLGGIGREESEGGDGKDEGSGARSAKRTRRDTADSGQAKASAAVIVPGTWSSVSGQFMRSYIHGRRSQQQQQQSLPPPRATASQHLVKEVRQVYFDAGPGLHGGPWYQPDVLLVSASDTGNASSEGGGRPGRRGTSALSSYSPPRLPSLGRDVRLGTSGLVAALYVSVEGVAYVAHPNQQGAVRGSSSVVAPSPGEGGGGGGGGARPLQKEFAIPYSVFPLEARDSFTRGFLGL